ncbi:SH3 domain-containing protein [Balamuthia mandrillaris]
MEPPQQPQQPLEVLGRLFEQEGHAMDISWPLQEGVTAWKDSQERKLQVHSFRSWEEHHARESSLSMGLHCGSVPLSLSLSLSLCLVLVSSSCSSCSCSCSCSSSFCCSSSCSSPIALFLCSRRLITAQIGTHIDAPSHFLKDGATIEGYNLSQLCGRCRVIDLSTNEQVREAGGAITAAVLREHDEVITAGSIVLLKTSNSHISPFAPFTPDFVYLEKSGAEYLSSKGVKAVGIDYLGIERSQEDHATHRILLGGRHSSEEEAAEEETTNTAIPIPIIEGLRLAHVEDCGRDYYLVCMPLALKGCEGAPARALLLRL